VQLAPDGTLILSATDLVGFLACDHLSTLELGRAEGLWQRPPRRDDPTVQLMQDRGDAHETAHLERLRAQGKSVAEISKDALTTPEALGSAAAATLEAMRAGADVVYQATFFDGRWRGHADFLYRVDRPSPVLGAWSYDIADTKLSRGVKGSAVLQMCVYADLLEKVQGVAPRSLYVVTGDGEEHEHLLSDYSAYYRHARERFEGRVAGGSGGTPTYPDPVDHCHVCVWYPTCIQRRRDDDHPSIVAGMRRVDTERFMGAGIPTLTAIAGLPADATVAEMPPRVLGRFRQQARLQLEERRTHVRVYELVEPDPEQLGRGLAALPEPSPFDVFLDLEADPWALDGGLEYLLGVVVVVDGEPTYLPFWGHDRAGEKAAFEGLIDLVMDRLAAHPEMHLYHYGGYESGAIKRLMQRHGTRVDEVDRLLRGGVLVDLLNVVRQGIRASVESYSLKQIEKFYLPAREGPVTEAGFSVVEYERWMRERDEAILANIAAYNRDDCISTWMLRSWLEDRRAEAMDRWPGADWSRPVSEDGAASEALTARMADVARRVDALTSGLPDDPAQRTEEEAARWLLAQLLDWHRRDEKPAWWLWHDLRQRSVEDLILASEGLGGLVYERDVEARKRSLVRRYRFEPQDHKFRVGQSPVDPNPDIGPSGEDAGQIIAIDDIHGTIDLLRGPTRLDHHPVALIPPKPIGSGPMPDALLRVADGVIAEGIDGPGPDRAARDLLLRRPPRVDGIAPGEPLKRPGERDVDAAIRCARDLQSSVLPIQGPPGTGKTWTGARMVVDLVRAGRRVGVAAQSHKAITNMLRAIDDAAKDPSGHAMPRAIQKCDRPDDAAQLDIVTVTDDNDAVVDGLAAGAFDIVAGTSWLFARPDMAGSLDTLFIDEAGQASLANVIAMSGAAKSIVLLGDPNQLPQVSQGVHPEGAGASGLEHLIEGATTMDPARGLFLETTYRLHPDVNEYISPTFYDGRLKTHPSTGLQYIDADPGLGGSGIRFVGVEHDGDSSSSVEEAEVVAEAVAGLIGRPWTNRHGEVERISLKHILVVAPYNAQVATIAAAVEGRLGSGARIEVGTVDKFQGQEGAVSIYSMTSSSRDDAPRDMDFLFSRNRLNVAVSRARAVSIVIANPRLLDASCKTPEQMRLVDALCRLVETADRQAMRAAGGVELLTLGLE
jgi:predicted RecB family nuclease